MLALTRRVGEEVVIGDPRSPLGIIRVVDIHGDKVRLSFDFPRDTPINRSELAEQKAQAARLESEGEAPRPDAGDRPPRNPRR
jgi:carbon storage regulator